MSTNVVRLVQRRYPALCAATGLLRSYDEPPNAKFYELVERGDPGAMERAVTRIKEAVATVGAEYPSLDLPHQLWARVLMTQLTDHANRIWVVRLSFREGAKVIPFAKPKPTQRTRLLKVIGATGAIVGMATLSQVIAGATNKAAVEIAVMDGTRPAKVLCVDCRAVVEVHRRGRIPKRCRACRRGSVTS